MTAARTVLCPIDFSPLSERALQLAVAMCRRGDARLVLEHNLESRPPAYLTVGWMWSEEHEVDEKEKMERAVEGLRRMFDEIPESIEYEAKVTHGPVDTGILYLAKNLPADLIVMGTHGPSSVKHKSLTERIIIQAPCPVLTMGEAYRPEAVFDAKHALRPEEMTILLPFDFTARSRAGLRAVVGIAERLPHRIHLLHCATPRMGHLGEPDSIPETEPLAERLEELVPEGLEERFETRVVVGQPVAKILEYAREINALFIFMSAHGKSPLRRFLFGTTTLGILHGSACPVWFIPPAVRGDSAWSAA